MSIDTKKLRTEWQDAEEEKSEVFNIMYANFSDMLAEIESLQTQRDDLLNVCEKAEIPYNTLIALLRTGGTRNRFTEQNILRLQAIAKAKAGK